MTEDEKTRYMHTALALVDIATNNFTAELMWRTFETLQEKQDQFSLRDASEIKALVEERYEAKSKKDDLLFRENMREYIKDVLKKEGENDIDKK